MARAFISLASMTAAAATAAALIRARRTEESPAQSELSDPAAESVRALDAARARLRAQVPPRPAVSDAA